MENKQDIAKEFNLQGEVIDVFKCGNGRINKTFKIETLDNDSKIHEYILQRINTKLFTDPDSLMNNIELVTEFVKKRTKETGSKMSVLSIVKTYDGKNYFKNYDGNCYRIYDYIKNSRSIDSCADNPELFYECGKIFGEFQNMLRDFDAKQLVEVIPNFHNTRKRYDDFTKAISSCVNLDRLEKAKDTISAYIYFAEEHKLPYDLCDQLEKGVLPLRVTHNDTKLNNVAFSKNSNTALAVLDLDTVMPGAVCYDFGDAIRFGCNTEDEESTDFEAIDFNKELFTQYVKGYLSATHDFLTEAEILSLPKGALTMTFECGMRFLTDYLNNDVYFGAKYEDNNLNRAINQLTYLNKLIQNERAMYGIIQEELTNIAELKK